MPSRLLLTLLLGTCCVVPVPILAEETTENPFAKWESAIQDFESDDAAHPKATGQVLFIGSSSIRKWDLSRSFPKLDALNRGFGGSQVADSVHFYERIVRPYAPRIIVMYAGDNDIAKGKSPQQVFADFQQFVGKTHADFPTTRIVYIAVKPSIKRWNLIDKVRETNSLIRQFSQADSRIEFVDIDAPMIGENGTPDPNLFVDDGLHLNEKGYELWTALVQPHLTSQSDVSSPTDVRFRAQRDIYDAYHPWTPPTTLERWHLEAERIRRQILVSNGLWPLPEKTPLKAVIHGKVERDDYTVEKVYFQSRPGHYVTGNLYRPKQMEGKVPAVLCPHGHWSHGRFYDAGNGAAAQLESGAEEFESGAHFPLQARMVQLARMGCVVFHYDMIGYADSAPLDHRTGFNDAQAALWLHNIMGLQTWNSIRCLDFVESLPEVDSQRLAVTGASGGGTQTMILAAIDPRVSVAFPAVMVSTGMQGGCVCENASYLRHGVNNIAFAALCAPRPQAMSGADDWTIEIESKGLPELKQVYALYGQADRVLAKAFPQFKHNYNQVSREVMYNWFNEHLHLGIAGPVKQSDFEPLSREEMSVFNEEHPLPADALDSAALREMMVQEDQAEFESWLQLDLNAYRQIVAKAVDIMLDPEVSASTFVRRDVEVVGESHEIVRGRVTNSEGVQIPTIQIVPRQESTGIVYWFDGAGWKHLFDAGGKLKSTPRALVQQGYTIVSAELFLTGSATGAQETPNRFAVNEKYPGYTFCYNRPLITERVRDVLAVVDAHPVQQGASAVLVGTGDAGVWVALARCVIPKNRIEKTVADLRGFQFDGIKTIDHPNLLPGALKYGGLPGLLRISDPVDVMLFGVNDREAYQRALSHLDDRLTLSSEELNGTRLRETLTTTN